MNFNVQNILKTDEKYVRYLRENSHWYKTLNRDPTMIKQMIEEMKERYSLRPTDKITNIIDTFDLITKFMDESK